LNKLKDLKEIILFEKGSNNLFYLIKGTKNPLDD